MQEKCHFNKYCKMTIAYVQVTALPTGHNNHDSQEPRTAQQNAGHLSQISH